jgi:hypothetical protein
MPTVDLNESNFVTLDSNGNGFVRLGPDEPAAKWLPSVISVSVSTNVNEADCIIYAGPAAVQAYFVDSTHSGSTGDSTDRIQGKTISRTLLRYVWAVWSGGDPGSQATVNVVGDKVLPG